jgi:hypothetical protein
VCRMDLSLASSAIELSPMGIVLCFAPLPIDLDSFQVPLLPLFEMSFGLEETLFIRERSCGIDAAIINDAGSAVSQIVVTFWSSVEKKSVNQWYLVVYAKLSRSKDGIVSMVITPELFIISTRYFNRTCKDPRLTEYLCSWRCLLQFSLPFLNLLSKLSSMTLLQEQSPREQTTLVTLCQLSNHKQQESVHFTCIESHIMKRNRH